MSQPPIPPHRRRRHSRERLIAVLALGLVTGIGVSVFWRPLYAPMCAWAVSSMAYVIVVWARVWHMDGRRTTSHAVSEDPGRRAGDILLLVCAVMTNVDLVFVMTASHGSGDRTESAIAAWLGLISVILNWAFLHTLFALRYAHLYHKAGGGIDFNKPDFEPSYQDFAYFSFNLGMTYQVSDTTVSEPAIRVTVLRHTLLAYLFSTFVLANVINIIVGIWP